METPIADFLRQYDRKGAARFHMPGHKGRGPLGCEPLDITEIDGADALYEASGIIAESEKHAASLFGARKTLYATEGSSQCIRAMLHLALSCRPAGTPPVILAARNVHKAFLYAAALLDFEPVWLWPEEGTCSLCSCPVSAQTVESALQKMPSPPAAVYLTSPDYLGGMAEIASIAAVCRRYGTLLLVDNAHGAYLHFLPEPVHPLDLGADLCCDSAHKTLPVLTGGAYLQIGKTAPAPIREQARDAMALFGSTSPSYLTLASLDLCNRSLAETYPARLAQSAELLEKAKQTLRGNGWQIPRTDPLRLTVAAPKGITGIKLAETLRLQNIMCEYADPEFLVLMVSPENTAHDIERFVSVMGKNTAPTAEAVPLPLAKGDRVCSVREALLAPHERVCPDDALGRICGTPAVSCPPAIPIAVSGERIGPEAIALFHHYGISSVAVLK